MNPDAPEFIQYAEHISVKWSRTSVLSLEDQITTLQRELAELVLNLPRHSPKPSQLIRIEELEEELARLKALCDEQPSGEP